MTSYRRAYRAGATDFFTVNFADRQSTLLVDHINDLREAVATPASDTRSRSMP